MGIVIDEMEGNVEPEMPTHQPAAEKPAPMPEMTPEEFQRHLRRAQQRMARVRAD